MTKEITRNPRFIILSLFFYIRLMHTERKSVIQYICYLALTTEVTITKRSSAVVVDLVYT